MRFLTLAFFLAITSCVSTPVSFPDPDLSFLPGGYSIEPGTELPEALEWESGEFLISVRRDHSSPEFRRLIEAAEPLYPLSDQIREALQDRWSGREHVFSRADSLDRVLSGPKWWIDIFDSTLLPYALSGCGFSKLCPGTSLNSVTPRG